MAQDLNWKRKKTQLRDLATEIDMIKDRIATTEKVNEGLQAEIDQRLTEQPKRRFKLAEQKPDTSESKVDGAKRNLLVKQKPDGAALSEKKRPAEFKIRKSPSGPIIKRSFAKNPVQQDESTKAKKTKKDAGISPDKSEAQEEKPKGIVSPKTDKTEIKGDEPFKLEKDNPIQDDYKYDFQ